MQDMLLLVPKRVLLLLPLLDSTFHVFVEPRSTLWCQSLQCCDCITFNVIHARNVRNARSETCHITLDVT